jgi:hypothetical protein
MKLWIDDIRAAPEGWQQARNVTDAIKTLARFGNEITEISLDHDISLPVSVSGEYKPFPSEETFQAVAYYMVKFWELELAKGNTQKPTITIHTANPVGGKELSLILSDFNVTIKPESQINRLESEV